MLFIVVVVVVVIVIVIADFSVFFAYDYDSDNRFADNDMPAQENKDTLFGAFSRRSANNTVYERKRKDAVPQAPEQSRFSCP
jgi:uncharacterized protein YxeA